MNYVEYFYEPVKNTQSWGEMSGRQLAFLCGLIKKQRPEKLVEIGVAAGGTTTVILNCISMLGLNTKVFSGDLSLELYNDKSKKTGYLAEEYKKSRGGGQNTNHILFAGKYAAEYLETVGSEIDFLILDTVHRLPGELLDFLACFPFLKQGCVVVLHDIALNHCGGNENSMATKVLLDLVAAEKMIDIDVTSLDAGIGAFIINEDTAKYLGNVFSALTLTWAYKPKQEELALYRRFYQKYYTEELLAMFDLAVKLNQRCLEEPCAGQEKCARKKGINKGHKKMLDKTVVIFGSGIRGRRLLAELRNECIDVSYFCDNNDQRWGSYVDGIEVKKPNSVSLNNHHYIVIAIKQAEGVREQILSFGVSEENLVTEEEIFDMNSMDYPDVSIGNEDFQESENNEQKQVSVSYVILGKRIKKYYTDRLLKITKDVSCEIVLYKDGELSRRCHGEMIVFLASDNYVQQGFIQKLIATYEKYRKNCVAGSKVISEKGQILSAGQIYWKDGVIENYLNGKPISCCESDFIRQVDGLVLDGMLIGKEHLSLFDCCMQANDMVKFFVELRKKGIPVIYQPESVILKNRYPYFSYCRAFEYKDNSDDYEQYAKDCTNGRKHTLKNITANQCKGYMLLVENGVPKYDQTAANRTIDQYIDIFQKMDLQIILLASNYLKIQKYTQRYQQKGIFVIYGVQWHDNRKEMLSQYLEDVHYAFFVWPHCSLEYIQMVKQYNPAIVTSYYGGDIHYIRLRRQYELTKEPKLLEESQRVEKQEDEIIKTADYTGYPSLIEVEILRKKFPNRNIQYYPAFYYPQRELRQRKPENKGLLFVGIFAHAPNTDGVLWFLQSIMPYLRSYGFRDSVYIIGGFPTDEILAYEDDQVIVTGHVTDEELAHYYETCRIAIAPLRFGAGIKGKVLEALYEGIPVVTTDAGAESIDVEKSGLVIANEAEAFADEVWKLYDDNQRIAHCCELGQKYVMHDFGEDALKRLFANQMEGK